MSTYPAAFFISEGSELDNDDPSWSLENMEVPPIHRPVPRRAFDLKMSSPEENKFLDIANKTSETIPMSRSQSVLNLTSSTLGGIYSDDDRHDESAVMLGGEVDSINITDMPEDLRKANSRPLPQALLSFETRPRRVSTKRSRTGLRKHYLSLVWQTCSLFILGLGFGVLVTHLQRSQQISPVPVPSYAKSSWGYQLTWGMLGVLIGNALPMIDNLLDDNEEAVAKGEYDIQQVMKLARSRSNASDMTEHNRGPADSGTGLFWQSAVRSAGAFVGIAFAVRRVPWQSTLQMSLTLAIANPVLWYLIDRSKSGFTLSSVVGIAGTILLLLTNPDFVPLPAIHQDQASESIGVFTWLASILFCTSLCFGAIGRKLQLE